jgi:HAD superfamily hydrolase (TIGR01509 family)
MRNTNETIKAVAFDLDHTLYDRNSTWSRLAPQFAQDFCLFLPGGMESAALLAALRRADYRATYEETSWTGMHRLLVGDGILSGAVSCASFRQFIDRWFPPSIVPYPDTFSVLGWCRKAGLRPSVITNGHRELQERKIAAMGLRPWLDHCIICDLDVGSGCKPAPDAFLQLARMLNLSPGEILYVGDNPVNDIQGARGAGMRTAWLNVMDNWQPEIRRADYEISCLSQLKEMIPVPTTQTMDEGGSFMPCIKLFTNLALPRERQERLKARFGQAIELIPRKTEKWLMCIFHGGCGMWFQGEPGNLAFVEIGMFGSLDRQCCDALTAEMMSIIGNELDMAPDHIYIQYQPTDCWGWNGKNL